MFYVYEWYIIETGEVIYVGKGSRKRVHEKSRRNKLFTELTKRFECTHRIVKSIENEDEAFECEYQQILLRKSEGQAVCNQEYGGNGGVKNNNWTTEMRNRMSENNPMKSQTHRKRMSEFNPMKEHSQKQRMSTFNPMKTPAVAEKVAIKHRKAVVIDGVRYESGKEASEHFGVTQSAISYWCKIGRNGKNMVCKYDNQQPSAPGTV